MRAMTELPEKYDYQHPAALIAQSPASPRDAARLLVYDRKNGGIRHDVFRNLPEYVPSGALLVVNETKVIPARLQVIKPSGGAAKILILERRAGEVRALCEKKLHPGEELKLKDRAIFRVAGKEEKEHILELLVPAKELDSLLEKYGEAPIPPYIKNSPLSPAELKAEYQAIFARRKGSAAAPTASLHFTPRLMSALQKRGVKFAFVTLHVGLGTFAPLTAENLKSGKLHKEWYEISAGAARAISRAKKEGRPVIAVGTTVVRTLESWAKTKKLRGETDLFIRPGFRFRMADGLITNFHVPRSSLLMLVSAFAGRERILSIYRSAVRRRYRLFSFGDGMLII